MKIKLFKKVIFDYKTYLFVGVIFIVFAPISDILHWRSKSMFFAKWAFVLFCVATSKAFFDSFLIAHPEIKKKLRTIKFKNMPWRH